MDPRTHERVERWESRPFSGGYDGLSDLADAEFSGAVTAGGAWAFMLNGRIVGVFDGALEAFESNQGTIYDSPHPSLPLLCTMHERDSETRAKYYTNDTPIHEVDRTLQNKSFTGYIELSEQVLSGDYYLVYYGGRRMAAAYIGNAERLLTGEEAFERTDDEVGIYRVVDTSVDITEIPSDESEPATAPTSSTGEKSAGTDLEPTDTDSVVDATPHVNDGEDVTGTAEDGITTTDSAVKDATPPNGITDTKETTDDLEGGADSAVSDDSGETTASTEDDQDPQPMPPASDDDTESVITEAETDVTPGQNTARETTTPATASAGDDETSDESRPTESVTPAGSETERETPPTDSDQGAQPMPPASSDGLEPDEVEEAANELDDDALPWNQDPAPDSQSTEAGESATQQTETDTSKSTAADPLKERFKREEQWRETRQIPSIDPDNSSDTPSSRRKQTGHSSSRSETRSRRRSKSETTTTDSNSSDTQSSEATRGSSAKSTTQSPRSRRQQKSTKSSQTPPGRSAEDALEPDMLEREDRIDQLTQKVDELEAEKSTLENRSEELESERDTLAAERAELQSELQSLREERSELSTTIDSLRNRIDELENELERVRDQRAAGIPVDATELSPTDALQGTNLFVRYGSKSQPTLKSAHDDDSSRDVVVENLRLEHHTQFDSENVIVNGQPYDEFLHSSMEFQLVRWLIETLPFEIRDTGHGDALGDLYDAIPFVDRAELSATISLEDDETEGVPDTVEFDVVVFDKMGNPLIAINLNDSREPATRGMLETMEADASAVKANHPELSAAFVVTSSFFEPGALEVVEQATGGGGFLSRDSRMSYVSLSRKQGGYHLCLAESRSGGFHMNVPEL
ncbi:transcriptional regulator [Halobacteria archaeon AArc-curdl1]|uniref:Transcriptional regulator n=1 Tax=Natronosalvus hydrolyticus TaxID=2979988 RepID=A0AAP2Z987_9EURY|nr:transcriptional regulator [Halobacteria archaeon AArc-curdl1]